MHLSSSPRLRRRKSPNIKQFCFVEVTGGGAINIGIADLQETFKWRINSREWDDPRLGCDCHGLHLIEDQHAFRPPNGRTYLCKVKFKFWIECACALTGITDQRDHPWDKEATLIQGVQLSVVEFHYIRRWVNDSRKIHLTVLADCIIPQHPIETYDI